MKNLFVVLSSVVMSFFLVSCSSKSALEYFDKSDLEARAFQESKKGDYIENGSPKVIVWATYLNNVDREKYNNNEEFLVSVYTSNSDKQGIKELGYSFSLNDNKALVTQYVDKKDAKNEKLLKLISKNNWGEYYLVSFAKSSEDNLSFKVLKDTNELINLSFVKAH